MKYSINLTDWKTDSKTLSSIRTQVFVEEQSVSTDRESDNKDDTATHWLAVDANDQPIGTARMLTDGHIGRMAVVKSARETGVGRALLSAVIEYAKSQNLFEAYLYAQTQAIGFYKKQGFTEYGEEFLDANIPHRSMRLTLCDRRLLGIHGGKFVIDDYKSSVYDLVSQTQNQLRLLSYNLDHYIYDNKEIMEAISSLARKSRYSDIRILVADTSPIIKRGHGLLELQRRLSSKISIKKVSCEPHLLTENLIISDSIGFICQSIRDPENVWGNYNNLPVAKTHVDEFDELWSRSVNDRDLQLLSI